MVSFLSGTVHVLSHLNITEQHCKFKLRNVLNISNHEADSQNGAEPLYYKSLPQPRRRIRERLYTQADADETIL